MGGAEGARVCEPIQVSMHKIPLPPLPLRAQADNAQIRKEMAAELVRGQQQQATTDQFQ